MQFDGKIPAYSLVVTNDTIAQQQVSAEELEAHADNSNVPEPTPSLTLVNADVVLLQSEVRELREITERHDETLSEHARFANGNAAYINGQTQTINDNCLLLNDNIRAVDLISQQLVNINQRIAIISQFNDITLFNQLKAHLESEISRYSDLSKKQEDLIRNSKIDLEARINIIEKHFREREAGFENSLNATRVQSVEIPKQEVQKPVDSAFTSLCSLIMKPVNLLWYIGRRIYQVMLGSII